MVVPSPSHGRKGGSHCGVSMVLSYCTPWGLKGKAIYCQGINLEVF